jgi:hypothetical protein
MPLARWSRRCQIKVVQGTGKKRSYKGVKACDGTKKVRC